ncbi:MAG: CAP domain-containing protein [Candidatus Peribacteraceae bacterium]|nr:CAP domain-containing protein [Candidatus Peribacteraceae bacterium]
MTSLSIRTLFVFCLLAIPVAKAEEPLCLTTSATNGPSIDMERVRKTWLGWNNRLRRRLKLQPYALDGHLNASATNWSIYAVQRGFIDHKRAADAAYYDYPAIEQWFANRGLHFKNIERITFTENIGWGTYACKDNDCTLAAIDAIRKTFRFYLAERNKASRAHYNSIVNAHFTSIGVGLGLSPEKDKYYLTVHYGTPFSSPPPPLCAAPESE